MIHIMHRSSYKIFVSLITIMVCIPFSAYMTAYGESYEYKSLNAHIDESVITRGEADYVEVCGIKWAKGNLQYDAVNGGNSAFQRNWRIAPYQWYYYHYNENISSYTAKTTDNQIDHFTWGVCGDWNYLHEVSFYCYARNTDINSKMFVDSDGKTETTAFENARYGDLAYWANKR